MIRFNYQKVAFIILMLMMVSCDKLPKDISSIHVEINKGSDARVKNQQNYELIQKKYSEKGIVIEYPQIVKLKDAAKQDSLNRILKSEAIKELHDYVDADSEVHMEISYEIKRQSERFLSVQYTGIRYVNDAAYPNDIFYTTNLDMEQALKLRLTDLINVDKPFLELLKMGEFTAIEPEQKDLIGNFTQDDLITLLTSADISEGSAEEQGLDTFSYLTRDSLGVSIPVAHAAGDHAEYEIPLIQIPDDIKQNKELWNELSPVVNQPTSTVSMVKLDTDQYEVEESQSFQTTFEGLGTVQFVSTYGYTEGFLKYFFFLLDDQGHILYPFSQFYGNHEWIARNGGVEAVAFNDVNKDGLKDVIIIANYDTGIHEPDRVDPFPIAGIYFQKKNKTFITLSKLDEAINDKGHNQTIKDVIQYVSKQQIIVN